LGTLTAPWFNWSHVQEMNMENRHRPLEGFRSYLRMLAGAQIPHAMRGQVDPSDLVQHTLLQAHEKQVQFRGGSDAELAAWLRAILRNAIVDALRRVTREPHMLQAVEQSSAHLEALISAADSSPSEQAARQEQLERLAQALEQLPEDQRSAVQMQQIHDCSVEEIAEALGKSKSAVGGLLKRGMRRLREMMQQP